MDVITGNNSDRNRHQSNPLSPVYSGPDLNIRAICKGVLKQDENTKLKALEKLEKVIERRSTDEDASSSSREGPHIDFNTFIPHWGFVYQRLCRDENRRVRIALQQTHTSVARKDPKATRSVLSYIIGPLWASVSDPASDVASEAALALDATVPRNRRLQALRSHLDSIVNYLRDLANGIIAHDDPVSSSTKAVGKKSKCDAEVQEQHRFEMDTCLGIVAATRLLGSEGLQLEGERNDGSDDVLATVLRTFVDDIVSKSLKDPRPRVRQATYGLLAAYASCFPSALSDAFLLSALVLPSLETNVSNLESAWIAAMSILNDCRCVERLQTCQACHQSSPLRPLIKQLKKGFYLLSAESCYPCLLPFLAKTPRSLLLHGSSSDFALEHILDAIWEGFQLRCATAPPVALSFAINAHAECAVYLSGEAGAERLQRAFAGSFKLSPSATEIALDELASLLAKYFKRCNNDKAVRKGGGEEQEDPSAILEEPFWELVNGVSDNDLVSGSCSSPARNNNSIGCLNENENLSLPECIRCGNWVGQLLSSAIKYSTAINMDCCKDRVGYSADSSLMNTTTSSAVETPPPTHSNRSIYRFCSALFWRCAEHLNPSNVAFIRHVVDVACRERPEEVVVDVIHRSLAILQAAAEAQKMGRRYQRGGTTTNEEEIDTLVDLVRALIECLKPSDRILQLCRLVAAVPKDGKWASQALCSARSLAFSFENNEKFVNMVKDCAEEALMSEELYPDMLQTCIGVGKEKEEDGTGHPPPPHNIDETNNGHDLSLVSFASMNRVLNRWPELAVSLFPALMQQQQPGSSSLRPSLLKDLAPYLLHIVFRRAFLDEDDEYESPCAGADFCAWSGYTTSTTIDEDTWDKFVELVITDLSLFNDDDSANGGGGGGCSWGSSGFLPVAPSALRDMLIIELDGNAPYRILRAVGITTPEAWRKSSSSDTGGGGGHMWSLTCDVLEGFPSQQERILLLRRASATQLEFFTCLVYMLQAGEADGSAADLLVPPGDLELSRVWKYGVDMLVTHKVEWWSQGNQFKKAQNNDYSECDHRIFNAPINAEGLGLLSAALEREEVVLNPPLPVRRAAPLAPFQKVPDIGCEAFYVESSVSVQHVKIIGVHQDPDGGEPYVTILPFSSQQSSCERQTTLCRLRKPPPSFNCIDDCSSWDQRGRVVRFGATETVKKNVVHVNVAIDLWYTTFLPLLRGTGRKLIESFSPFDMTESRQFLEDVRIGVIPILRYSANSCTRAVLLSEDNEVQVAIAESFASRGFSTEHFCATIGSVCTEWLGILETSARKADETHVTRTNRDYLLLRACTAAEIMSAAFTNTLALAKMVAVPSLDAMELVVSLVLSCNSGSSCEDLAEGIMLQVSSAALLLVKSISESIKKWEWKGDDFSFVLSSVESLLALCTTHFFPIDRIILSSKSSFVSSTNSKCGWTDSITLLSDAWIAFMKCSNQKRSLSSDVLASTSILAVKMMLLQIPSNTAAAQLAIGIAEISCGLSFGQRRAIWRKVVRDEDLLRELVDKALLKEPPSGVKTVLPAIAVLSAAVPALLHSEKSSENCILSTRSNDKEEDVYLSEEQQVEKDCEIVRESLPYVVTRVIQYLSAEGDDSKHCHPCLAACSRSHDTTEAVVSFHDGNDDDDDDDVLNNSNVRRKSEEWANYFTSTPVNPHLARLVLQRCSPNFCRTKEQNDDETRNHNHHPLVGTALLDYEAFSVLQRWLLVLEILNIAGFQNVQLESEVRLALAGVISHKKIFLVLIPLCFSCLQVRRDNALHFSITVDTMRTERLQALLRH